MTADPKAIAGLYCAAAFWVWPGPTIEEPQQ